ncbi:uncharacterized protein EHS24_004200 [Apiotrichum porosum]|uniref:Uncharacterized protein n=1 Tax=Apiotrichum porosum TaxID=105984 RepID=A0A427Y4L4_9TREE|nr:uncharacterized protein EHS24_004200 [Apiotrichum porosum]RSH86007.1 hypothetical protein EHS24_004200 [Apiotrichum porosum]
MLLHHREECVNWRLVRDDHRDPELHLSPRHGAHTAKVRRPAIKPWASTLVTGWVIQKMDYTMEREMHDRLEKFLALSLGGCPTTVLPPTRAQLEDEPEGSFLRSAPARHSRGENDSALSVMQFESTYQALITDMLPMFPAISSTHAGIDTHFDAVLSFSLDDDADAISWVRPDLIAELHLGAPHETRPLRRLSVVELKSLTTAPDSAFDALDQLGTRKFYIAPAATPNTVTVTVTTTAQYPTRLRPRPPRSSPPSGPQYVAATNIADVAGYCLKAGVATGLWSSVARHVPIFVDRATHTIYFGSSYGHRLRGAEVDRECRERSQQSQRQHGNQSESSEHSARERSKQGEQTDPGDTDTHTDVCEVTVKPDPSFLFIRTTLDLWAMEALEAEMGESMVEVKVGEASDDEGSAGLGPDEMDWDMSFADMYAARSGKRVRTV